MTDPRRGTGARAATAYVLAALMGVLAFGGRAVGEEDIVWYPGASLPADLKIRAVALSGPSTGVVAGYRAAPLPAGASPRALLEAEQAVVMHSADGGDTFTAALETSGAVIAVDFCDERHGWAVVSRPRPTGEGSLYFLFTSENGGAAWREISAISARSVTQVVRSSVDCGWILGSGTLMRSSDAGVSWTEVTAPGKRSSSKERISADGRDGLIIAGPVVYRTRNLGEAWETVDLAGGRAQAAGGPWLVVQKGDAVSFGSIQGTAFEAKGRLPGGVRAERIVVMDGTVRVLADHSGSGDAREVALLHSTDGGATFREETLPAPATGHVGLWGADGAWVVTLDRRLLSTR